jgi:septal ring factor EnvC (AmiA/AmiB activator)
MSGLLLRVATAAFLAAAVLHGAPAAAQSPSEQERALQEARETLRQSEERRQALAAEVEALRGERGKLQAALIGTAATIRERQATVQERETRLGELGESERQLKASLAGRRGVLAEVIAALQRMGRRPPPALLVRPDDALEALRSAILLGAVVPEMRVEAEALGSDLREMTRLKLLMTQERDGLGRDIADLGQERERLAALVEERQMQIGAREGDVAGEAAKASALARDVRDLEGLITRMQQEVAGARAASEAAQAAEAARRPAGADARRRVDLAALQNLGRMAPAVPFAETRGRLPLPVSGPRLREFGRSDGVGGVEKGLSISATAGAPVTAPSDGWVLYAGPFRSYGQLLILDAGGGYHVLLAGMERIDVAPGQFVLAGEPVATMRGDGAGAMSPPNSSRPVLYVEFRKDGSSIDPSPWWAGVSGEKVGG